MCIELLICTKCFVDRYVIVGLHQYKSEIHSTMLVAPLHYNFQCRIDGLLYYHLLLHTITALFLHAAH